MLPPRTVNQLRKSVWIAPTFYFKGRERAGRVEVRGFSAISGSQGKYAE